MKKKEKKNPSSVFSWDELKVKTDFEHVLMKDKKKNHNCFF